MSDKKTLILSIAHPYDLIFFLRLARESTIKQGHLLKIIFQEHNYFIGKEKLAKDILKEISENFVFIRNNEIPSYGKNILKNLILALKLKKTLKTAVSRSNQLLILDKSTLKANILLSYFEAPILLQFPVNETDTKNWVLFLKKQFLINIYHTFLNLHPVKVWKLKNSEKLIEQYFINFPNLRKVHISNIQDQGSINFSSIIKTQPSQNIAIFGSRYLGWNLPVEAIEKIHKYYRNIYDVFKDKASFIYIAHPLEKGREFEEVSDIFKKNIKNETSYLNSEHFLLENLHLSHCFSIGSTSSKSAYQMGLNSKIAYRSILSGTGIVDAFASVFADLPDHMHIDYDNVEDIRKTFNPAQIKANFNKLYEVLR
jgi:hypothetical protein